MLEHTNIHIGRVMAETSKPSEGDSLVVTCVAITVADGVPTPLYDLRVVAARKGQVSGRAAHNRVCEWCGLAFVAKHPYARFCGTTCRVRAHRASKAGE